MYKDATRITNIYRALLIILTALLFLELCVEAVYWFKLDQGLSLLSTTQASIDTDVIKNWEHSIANIENIYLNLYRGRVITFILSIIFYCIWIYRINCNTKNLGVQNLKYNPGVAIWSMFIPVYNLFGPFLAVKETWQANITPLNHQKRNVPTLFNYWWGAKVLMILCVILIGTNLNYYPSIEARMFLVRQNVILLLLNITTRIMTILVVNNIQNAQKGLHQNNNEENTSFTKN